MGGLFDGLFARLAEALVPRLLALFEVAAERLAPRLLALLVFSMQFARSLVGPITEGLANLGTHLALTLIANNPQSMAAAELMSKALGRALAADHRMVVTVMAAGAGALLAFAGLPLLYKALSRRRQRVFVSFNHLRQGIASDVQAVLHGAGAQVERIPFDERATHQDIVIAAARGIRDCHAMVCIPGPSASYVEHEVLAATTARKPVVFVVSETAGTLPNTADKRYPVFKLETTQRAGFEPLVAFLSYVDADLRSTWVLCRGAFAHPFMSISAWAALGVSGGVLLLLWGWCFAEVLRLGTAIASTVPDGAAVRSPVLLAHGAVFAALLAVAVLCVGFCALVTINLARQLRARARARLETTAARFDRDDWLGRVPGLSRGGALYACLFDAAPRAHHESAGTAA